MNKHDFVFDYQFKLFSFPNFEIDGTSDEVNCDLFIYDTKNNFTINVTFQDEKFFVKTSKDERKIIAEFDFCENFEEKLFEIYKTLI